jgi:multiple sugar transport system ATP-binding protein
MATISIDRVDKTYPNGYVAARDLSLAVDDGELLVLVGPSGSGKSTILRMIAGLEQVSAGRIRIGDRDVTNLPPQERDLAMVFQSYALYPHMTVRENLTFGLRMRRTPAATINQRTAAAADALGLGPVLDRKPAQLSGGQRQRVALGRAIVREPAAFLFDEPLSNLDAQLRGDTRAELARLHRRLGATMVYVTHDQVEAMTLGDRVAVLRDGALQQLGAPMELYDRPANRFVAGFIGSPAMEFLDGVLEEQDGRTMLRAGSRGIPVPQPLEQLPSPEIVLGIRASRVELAAPGTSDPSTIPAMVGVVERLGREQLVHLDLDVGIPDRSAWPRLTAIVPAGYAIRPDQEAGVRLPLEAIYLFRGGAEGARIAT